MKKRDSSLTKDVEKLLETATLEEATAEVFSRFDNAIEGLDQQSREIFQLFLAGMSVAEISRNKNLEEKQLVQWMTSIKRDVLNQLRVNCKVRQ